MAMPPLLGGGIDRISYSRPSVNVPTSGGVSEIVYASRSDRVTGPPFASIVAAIASAISPP